MTRTNDLIAGSFTAIVGNMYQQGVTEALPWIFAMTAVVIADLCTGIRKCWMMGEEVRWSKGIRCTMSKLITYYAFVVCAVLVNVASGSELGIAKWACLGVCAIEGMSIAGNILKPHGIDLNIVNLIKSIGKKVDVDLDEVVSCKPKKKKK